MIDPIGFARAEHFDQQAVIRTRQPENAPDGHFTRVFTANSSDDLPQDMTLRLHADNARETLADATRRGLRAVSGAEVTVLEMRRRTAQLVDIVYGVRVAPTAAAASIHAPTQVPARVASDAPEPEYTADPVPAAEAPVPARASGIEDTENAG